jgi:hypothetical protein
MSDITTNMVSYLFIAIFLVIFTTIGLSDYNWNNTTDALDTIEFNYDENLKLSENGRVALHNLKKAESYSFMRVGVGGRYSTEYNNFAIIMHEKNAENALKSLVLNGNTPAQVYGLIGLKIKNPSIIEKLKPSIIKSKKTIEIHGGCTCWDSKVSLLLFGKNVGSYEWFEQELNQRYLWLKNNGKLFQEI